MNKIKKMLLTMTAVTIFTAAFSMSAFASSKKINNVTIHVSGNIEVEDKMGEENLEITTNSSDKYDYDSYEVQNTGFRWAIDDTPDIKITLTAADDYYFNITKASQITLTGCTYVSANRYDSSTTLVVEVKLTPLANQVGKIETASMTDGKCTWDAAVGAGSYEIKFMRNNTTLGGRQILTTNSYDGGQYMTKAGEYHFMVRPVNQNDTTVTGAWVDSNHVVISAEQAKKHIEANEVTQSAGEWEQDGSGWRFRLPDGTYPAGTWREIKSAWYYFNDDSNMATGWKEVNGKWYYLDPESGAMWKNRETPDGYFVGIDGSM